MSYNNGASVSYRNYFPISKIPAAFSVGDDHKYYGGVGGGNDYYSKQMRR
jgi:hypothetical protein